MKDLTTMEDFCKFSLMSRTHKTQRRGSGMLMLAYLWTLFSLVRTQSGGISLNQECERTLSDGTIEYLACSASSEALSQLDLSVSVDPVNSTCGLSPDVSRKIYSTLVICFIAFWLMCVFSFEVYKVISFPLLATHFSFCMFLMVSYNFYVLK